MLYIYKFNSFENMFCIKSWLLYGSASGSFLLSALDFKIFKFYHSHYSFWSLRKRITGMVIQHWVALNDHCEVQVRPNLHVKIYSGFRRIVYSRVWVICTNPDYKTKLTTLINLNTVLNICQWNRRHLQSSLDISHVFTCSLEIIPIHIIVLTMSPK